jgi:hypothetical protein
VTDRVRLPGGATAVALEGLHRGHNYEGRGNCESAVNNSGVRS